MTGEYSDPGESTPASVETHSVGDRDLASISPDEAVAWYLEHRSDELRAASKRKQDSTLGTFVAWTDEAELDDLSDLRGRDLMAYKTWLKRESDLTPLSLSGKLAILRRFVGFRVRIEAVEPAMVDRVPLPNVPEDAEVSHDTPTDEEVEAMRAYYRRFEYASRNQMLFEVMAEIGLRLGAVRAIDLEDVDLEGYHYLPLDRATGGGRSDDEDPARVVVDTLRMPAPEADADPAEVSPHAESAVVVVLESDATLSVTDPTGRAVPTVDVDGRSSGGGAETIAWDIGGDVGEYDVEVVGDVADDYALDVTGVDPAGGAVASSIEDSVARGETHEVTATPREDGAGEARITERREPGTSDGRSSRRDGGSTAVESSGGSADGWSAAELGVLGGVLTLVGYGYLSRPGE